MRYGKCVCGHLESWSTDGFPACQVCEKCGFTVSSHPDFHPEPKPHDFMRQYDQNTGKPFNFCMRCGQKESIEEAKT